MSTHGDRLRRLFEGALEVTAEEREAWLIAECDGDESLKAEVVRLLAYHLESSPIDRPMVRGVARDRDDVEDSGPAPIPDQIGGYPVIRLLGEGGAGSVYEARDIGDSDRRVAIKVLRFATVSASMRRRFQLEAELLARLDHPYVAKIYATGEAGAGLGRCPYLVMEFVDGAPLDEFVRSRNIISREERIELLVAICKGVGHAHGRGVLHRDLKPANILVDDAGLPRLVDFGVATLLDSEPGRSSMHTATGQLLGTLAYMSPEKVRGDVHVADARSDVYALGVIGYQLLCGSLPIDIQTGDLPESIRRISEGRTVALSSFDSALAGDLEVVIQTALESDPDRRYPTVSEFEKDLRRVLTDSPIEARPPDLIRSVTRFAKRHTAAVVATALSVLAIGLGGLMATVGLVEAREEARRADESLRSEKAATVASKAALVRADDTLEFLKGMLLAVDPVSLGHEVTLADVLAAASDSVGERFSTDPMIAADLRALLGRAYRTVGDFVAAERELSQAVSVWSVEAPDRAEVVSATAALASLRRKLGRTEEACAVLEQIVYPQFDEAAPDVLTIRVAAELARTYSLVGRVGDSVSILRRCAKLLAGSDRVRPMELAEYYCRLGSDLIVLRQYPEAEEVLLAVHASEVARVGPDHADARYVEVYLADLYDGTGRADEAEALYRRAIPYTAGLYGKSHPRTQAVRGKLAALLLNSGKREEAIRELRSNLSDARSSGGPDSIAILETLQGLGQALLAVEENVEAEVVLKEYVEMASRVYGVDAVKRTLGLCLLAYLYAGRGDHGLAVIELEEACRILRVTEGGSAEQQIDIPRRLGHAYVGKGDAKAAAIAFETCAVAAARHGQVLAEAEARMQRGSLLLSLGDQEGAEVEWGLVEAFDLDPGSKIGFARDVFEAERSVARGDRRLAADQYQRILDQEGAAHGLHTGPSSELRGRLVPLLIELAELKRAEDVLRSGLDACVEAFGDEHESVQELARQVEALSSEDGSGIANE